MTTTELVANKIQEILGGRYEVKAFSFFARDYIAPMTTPYGTLYDIKYQAFEQMQDIIPVSVNVQETSPINSPLFYRTGIVTVQFYVPVNALGKSGSIDFFADFEHLRKELTDGRVLLLGDLKDTDSDTSEYNDYIAYFTLAEPSTNGAVQNTGAFNRMVFISQGNVTITDNNFKTGDDYQVAIHDGENWQAFSNITNLNISRDTQGNSVQGTNTTNVQSPPVSRVHTLSFSVADTDDPAVDIIRKAVFQMPEIIVENSNATTEAQAREVLVRLSESFGDGNIEFWAVLTADYTVANKSSVGNFTVTLTRTDDNIQGGE